MPAISAKLFDLTTVNGIYSVGTMEVSTRFRVIVMTVALIIEGMRYKKEMDIFTFLLTISNGCGYCQSGSRNPVQGIRYPSSCFSILDPPGCIG